MTVEKLKNARSVATLLHDFAQAQGYSAADMIAAEEAYKRKHRLSHPPGSFDKAGRFSLQERAPCCDDIRTASRAHPYSEMLHGRSFTHVACLHGVKKLHVQRLVKALETASMPAAPSAHQSGQLLVKLRSILKPV